MEQFAHGGRDRLAAGAPAELDAAAQGDADGEAVRRTLAQLRDELAAVQRAKQEFMANIGHELRTPMNAILGFTQLLLREPLTGDQQQKLRCVHRAAISLLGSIEQLAGLHQVGRRASAALDRFLFAAPRRPRRWRACSRPPTTRGWPSTWKWATTSRKASGATAPASVRSSSTCWTTP